MSWITRDVGMSIMHKEWLGDEHTSNSPLYNSIEGLPYQNSRSSMGIIKGFRWIWLGVFLGLESHKNPSFTNLSLNKLNYNQIHFEV